MKKLDLCYIVCYIVAFFISFPLFMVGKHDDWRFVCSVWVFVIIGVVFHELGHYLPMRYWTKTFSHMIFRVEGVAVCSDGSETVSQFIIIGLMGFPAGCVVVPIVWFYIDTLTALMFIVIFTIACLPDFYRIIWFVRLGSKYIFAHEIEWPDRIEWAD